jgi:hypothetical protein
MAAAAAPESRALIASAILRWPFSELAGLPGWERDEILVSRIRSLISAMSLASSREWPAAVTAASPISRPFSAIHVWIVPHQANKTMVIKLAGAAGITPDQLYFNIETVGNTSAASIPLAIADAKSEGVITEPLRVFAPGSGAGAVGGYAVLRIDPAVIAPDSTPTPADGSVALDPESSSTSSDNIQVAFG